MEIKYYLRSLLNGWLLIALTMLIALEVTMVADYFTQPIYRANATFAVSPNISQLSSSSDVLNSLDTLDKRSVVTTYAEFLNSDRIYNETLTSLNIDPASLVGYTKITTVITGSNVLELTVEGTDPNTTAMLANLVGENAISSIKVLYSAYNINLLDPAVPAKLPIRPVPLRDAGLALALGFVVGCGLAILKVQIQTSLDSFLQQNNRDKESQAYSRSYMQRHMEQELVRNPNGELSFGLVQLDGLGGVVSNLPQNLVKDLMRVVTQTFQKELRGSDMISRWDDITYAILLPTTSEGAAKRTINRLCEMIVKPVYLKDYNEKISLKPIMSVTTSKENETAEDVVSRTQNSLKRTVDLRDVSDNQAA